MERERTASLASFYAPGEWCESLTLGADAAHHASVRRLKPGNEIQLTSGDGRLAPATIQAITKQGMDVRIAMSCMQHIPAPPQIELWAPVGDRERMLWLAEKTAELGLSSWQPIVYERSKSVSPRGEGEAFRTKVRARQIGAVEQSGNAWLPVAREEENLESALHASSAPGPWLNMVLDARGAALSGLALGLASVRIACGPEGGITERETALFERSGWRSISLGENVLRFETAGVAALACLRLRFSSGRAASKE